MENIKYNAIGEKHPLKHNLQHKLNYYYL